MQSPDVNWIFPLHRLLTVCRESRDRYFAFAREVRDIDLKYLFSSYALQRGKFLVELEFWAAVGPDSEEGNRAGTRGAFSGNRDEREVLWDCLAKEEEVLQAYREAESAGGPAELREVLGGQIREVIAAQSRLRKLQFLSEDAG